MPVERFDRDVLRAAGELTDAIDRVHSGQARILVGTQMLTKGHHFPDVTLVVVLNADQSLFATDFRAAERLAQTIVQVAGRAGRADRPGEVLIQSQFPDNPLLKTLLEQGYAGFAAERAGRTRRPRTGRRLRAWRCCAPPTPRPPAPCNSSTAARALLAAPAGVVLQPPVPASHGPPRRPAPRPAAGGIGQARAAAGFSGRLGAARWRSCPRTRSLRWALDVDPLDVF